MTDLFTEPRGGTPLEPEEREGLLPTWVITRDDLNAAEAENIVAGAAWARRHRGEILTDDFVRALHRRMFEDVWAWAGTYRQSARNIGVEWYQISVEIHALLGDTRYWCENQIYAPDEIAVRLHHRIVLIHPFPNGNGRHSRLIADTLAVRLGLLPFSWGRADLVEAGEVRDRYLSALRDADRCDLEPLLEFAQS